MHCVLVGTRLAPLQYCEMPLRFIMKALFETAEYRECCAATETRGLKARICRLMHATAIHAVC